MKKTAAQLEREIAASLKKKRPRRHHSTKQDGAAADWDVAMDAILSYDPKTAAKIVASIREELGIPAYAAITMDAPATFVDALEEVPAERDHFFKALKELQAKKPKPEPGSPEFTEKAPGVMTLYVPGHGYFSASAPTYLRYKRVPRAKLVKKVLQIYEGTRSTEGGKPSHWRQYDKDSLAMIVADAYGDDAF